LARYDPELAVLPYQIAPGLFLFDFLIQRIMGLKRMNSNIPDAINCSITKEFTQIPNELLRNPEISGKAKALLCLLLSNKEGWKSCISGISKMMKEGSDAINSGINELEEYGYLIRVRYRDKKTKTWKGSFWAYTDIPYSFNIQKNIDWVDSRGLEIYMDEKTKINLNTENPDMENPDMVIPNVENPGLIILNNKNTNIKKTNNKKNIKLHSPEQNSGEIDSSKSKKLSIVERNKQCLPICSKLSQIIRSKKNIKHTPTQLRSWSNEIRKLIEGNKISADRINQVLDWYKGTIGEKYIPVIESGASLREKFTRLEDAMKRDTNYIEEDYNPDEILESHFDSDWLLGVMKSNYERVCQFAGKDDEAELARSLCSLYDWIKGNQDPDVLTKVNDNINPSGLIRQYIAWLNDQAWLDNEISSQTFSPKNNLFRKMFLGDKNKELNIDVLTGKFIPSYESR
jgi:hypothetical protein